MVLLNIIHGRYHFDSYANAVPKGLKLDYRVEDYPIFVFQADLLVSCFKGPKPGLRHTNDTTIFERLDSRLFELACGKSLFDDIYLRVKFILRFWFLISTSDFLLERLLMLA